MAADTRYVPGAWNAICDMCGRQFKNFELVENWKGQKVCPSHWEPRHPQDFAHGIPDNMSTPWSRPQPAPNFVSTGTSAIATELIAGRGISGNLF